jgi:branched-chain amino acid transport system substrate-binding protein
MRNLFSKGGYVMKKTMKMMLGVLFFCFLVSLIWTVQPTVAKEPEEILIGAHVPITGIGSMVGIDQKWTYEQAVADINKEGGIYVKEYDKKLPVKLIVLDDESDAGKAAAAVERLVKRKDCKIILSGTNGAMGVLPGMITAEKFKVYYHGTLMWIENFLEHNFQWATLYNFDMNKTGAMPFELWKTLPEDQRPQRPAVFVEDTFDGKMMGDGWEMLLEKYGYKMALRQSMGLGAKDFTSQILKAKAANVDAILCLSNTPEIVTLVRQMKENKFSVKFFQGYKGTWSPGFYEALGEDADYILCDGFWSEDYPFKGAKELGKRYYKEFGTHSVSVGTYYALCQILWEAIEKAGTLDPANVRQAVLNNEFETVNGTAKYDERAVALYSPADFQWRKGKQQNIYPFEFAKYKVKVMPPWDER